MGLISISAVHLFAYSIHETFELWLNYFNCYLWIGRLEVSNKLLTPESLLLTLNWFVVASSVKYFLVCKPKDFQKLFFSIIFLHTEKSHQLYFMICANGSEKKYSSKNFFLVITSSAKVFTNLYPNSLNSFRKMRKKVMEKGSRRKSYHLQKSNNQPFIVTQSQSVSTKSFKVTLKRNYCSAALFVTFKCLYSIHLLYHII